MDATILKVDVVVTQDKSCLALNFGFFSEEFPEWVGAKFNDGFIAEVDKNTCIPSAACEQGKVQAGKHDTGQDSDPRLWLSRHH